MRKIHVPENESAGKVRLLKPISLSLSLAGDFNIFLADEMKFTSQRNLLSVGRSVGRGRDERDARKKEGKVSEFLA